MAVKNRANPESQGAISTWNDGFAAFFRVLIIRLSCGYTTEADGGRRDGRGSGDPSKTDRAIQ